MSNNKYIPIRTSVSQSYQSLAITVVVVYEIILNNTTLLSYILISPRGPDLLSKNREGVFSFIGYLAIFLAGRGIGVPLVKFNHGAASPPSSFNNTASKPTTKNDDRDSAATTNRERISILRSLASASLVYILLYLLSTSLYTFNLTVSRRVANLPYVLWVVAFNTVQVLLFAIIEHLGPSISHQPDPVAKDTVRHATSRILMVFNNNGLVVFLVANLLTGLVNLSINTLDMAPVPAMGVLVGYAIVVSGVAMGLDVSGVRIKL